MSTYKWSKIKARDFVDEKRNPVLKLLNIGDREE